MVKTNVLIIEDDETASFLTQEFLEDCGFAVDAVSTVTDGLSYLKIKKYDILLLDLNLTDYSGFELLSSIKNSIAIPTIIISAYSDTDTKVKAFRYGANDYLTKPVDFRELEARIWALLSRKENILLKEQPTPTIFEIKNNQIYKEGIALNLTALEFDILSFFILHKGQIISRDTLTQSISSVNSHRLLDNHIKNIRKKIENNSSKPIYLKTEYGVGYKFIVD